MSAPSESHGTRVTTEADFPQVAIYERQGTLGPVYNLTFDNLEFGSMREFFMRLLSLGMMALIIPGALLFGAATERFNVSWIIGVGVFVTVTALVYQRSYLPFSERRRIELDFGQDRLRVMRNDELCIERTLSRLDNLTVEKHPEAELMREARHEKGDKKLTSEEKQHSLIGWFGVGGSEQVVLLSRVEWPNRNSLFEVRQALMWVMQRAPAAQQTEQRSGLNPPLD